MSFKDLTPADAFVILGALKMKQDSLRRLLGKAVPGTAYFRALQDDIAQVASIMLKVEKQ